MAVWPDGLIIFQYLAVYNNGNFAQEHKKCAKLGSKFCQSLNNAFKNCLRLYLIVQSGEIWQIWSHWAAAVKLIKFVRTSHFILSFKLWPFDMRRRSKHSSTHLPSHKVAVWPDLAIYWTMGNFLKPLTTINWPKSATFLGNFSKVSKSIIIRVKSFLGNFYRHLAIFFWSHLLLFKT